MSMAQIATENLVDGKMVDWRDAKIHVLSHTLHYGCGAFEGVARTRPSKARRFSVCRAHPASVQQRQDPA